MTTIRQCVCCILGVGCEAVLYRTIGMSMQFRRCMAERGARTQTKLCLFDRKRLLNTFIFSILLEMHLWAFKQYFKIKVWDGCLGNYVMVVELLFAPTLWRQVADGGLCFSGVRGTAALLHGR